MLARLVALGRPAAFEAVGVSRAVVAAAWEPSTSAIGSQLSGAASSQQRDGGREASTSYGSDREGAWSPLRSSPSCSQRRLHATLASPTAAAVSADATTTAVDVEDAIEDADDPLLGLDMESLMRVIVHPLPLGRVRNPALFSGAAAPVVQLGNESLFFDPTATLSSTMRALYVIRQVLRSDGHVLIVNPNPAMRPLMREAAHLCLNRNVWFWSRDWQSGILSDRKRGVSSVLIPDHCQPNRRLMAKRGLELRNPLCPPGYVAAQRAAAAPTLGGADMQRLLQLARGGRSKELVAKGKESKHVLASLMAARTAEARLLPDGSPPTAGQRGGKTTQLALVVSLDLSYGGEAVREAYERNIPTVSLLNGHSDASCVTFPVYASESHAGYQHFFLEWLLRVVNMPRSPAAAAAREERQQQKREGQAAAKQTVVAAAAAAAAQ
ncbi:hypothetical protein Agub_g13942 [Astrephomene gubernaculifera]|uniref:Ribosomal protein S2 n=1 Tax=Astrephomene gubernaculifera TaxID=47775 RepID=A0AAD3E4X3_9CHLO|nr:hypothetical protein Agub_g13942 [Astrephomene gubernaculifera]